MKKITHIIDIDSLDDFILQIKSDYDKYRYDDVKIIDSGDPCNVIDYIPVLDLCNDTVRKDVDVDVGELDIKKVIE